MANLNSKKWKKSSFYEEKSLVGLTQGVIIRSTSWPKYKFVVKRNIKIPFFVFSSKINLFLIKERNTRKKFTIFFSVQDTNKIIL